MFLSKSMINKYKILLYANIVFIFYMSYYFKFNKIENFWRLFRDLVFNMCFAVGALTLLGSVMLTLWATVAAWIVT